LGCVRERGEEVLNEMLDEIMRRSPDMFGLRATGLRMYWTGKGGVQKESIGEIPCLWEYV
jgi:hypothetical protein